MLLRQRLHHLAHLVFQRFGCASGCRRVRCRGCRGASAHSRVIDKAQESVPAPGSPVPCTFLPALCPERGFASVSAFAGHDLSCTDDLLHDCHMTRSIRSVQRRSLAPHHAGPQLRLLTYGQAPGKLDKVFGVHGPQIFAAPVTADLIKSPIGIAHAVGKGVAQRVRRLSLDGVRPSSARLGDVIFVARLRSGQSRLECSHSLSLLGFCVPVIILLPERGPALFRRLALICRALKLQQDCI